MASAVRRVLRASNYFEVLGYVIACCSSRADRCSKDVLASYDVNSVFVRLEVGPADPSEVRKCYKQLALQVCAKNEYREQGLLKLRFVQVHPDKNPSRDATSAFRALSGTTCSES